MTTSVRPADPGTAAPSAGTAGTAATGSGRSGRRPLLRGERGVLASLGLHGVLAVTAFVAAFPVAWIVFISLGPNENDYLHPGRIFSRMSLSNYRYVIDHTGFGTWLMNSLIVGLGTMAVGVLIAASAGYAVSRMRFPGHRQLMYTFLLTQMFPVAVLLVPLYKIMAGLNLLDT